MNITFDKHKAPCVFIRISKKSYIDELVQQGKVYFSHCSKFANLESTGNQFIGDAQEGLFPSSTKIFVSPPLENADYSPPLSTFSELPCSSIQLNAHLFCLMELDDFKLENGIFRRLLPWSLIQEFISHYNIDADEFAIAVILDIENFISVLLSALARKNSNCAYGHVLYDKDSWRSLVFPSGEISSTFEPFFHKRQSYQDQKEFRFVVTNHSNRTDIDNIRLPSMQDFCFHRPITSNTSILFSYDPQKNLFTVSSI